MIEPGFYRQSNKEYHAGPGISKSGLAIIRDYSPAHFKTPQEQTPATIKGDAFHVATLEPDRFDKEYTVLPADCSSGSGKGMQERKDLFLKKNQHKTILSQTDYDLARRMSEAVHNCLEAMELLSNGESELSGYWYDPDLKHILCKFRLDWIKKTDQIIVDLKSTTDARFYPFQGSAFSNNYHMQAGWYCYGVTHITRVEHNIFKFIAVEKKPPYGIKVYQASDDMINLGLVKCQEALEIYAKCLEKDEWPNYQAASEILYPPQYLMKAEMKKNFIIE